MTHVKGKGTLVWEHMARAMRMSTTQAHMVMYTGHDSNLAGRYQVVTNEGICIVHTDEELIRRFPYAEDAIQKVTS